MAQTLLSGNISAVYDKLLFRKADGKVYYTNTGGDADALMFGNLEDTALSTWAGTSNITTLGTIGTGTWEGTTIAVNQGGSGQTSYTNGQLLIGNTTGNTLTKATLTGTANEVEVTNGTGTITIGLPSAVTLSGITTMNGTLVLQNGATIDNSTAGAILEFKSEDSYKFSVSDAIGDLSIVLSADGGGSAVDVNRIRSADGGTFYIENYEGSSYSTSLAVDKDGKLILGGNIIRNSDNEDVLTVTADQKLQIASNIIQNTQAEDVITMSDDQNVRVEGELTVGGNRILFGDGGLIHNSTDLLYLLEPTVAIGDASAGAILSLHAGASNDSRVEFREGVGFTGKWIIGNDATDDSFKFDTGGGILGAATRLSVSTQGVLTIYGAAGRDGILNIASDNNAAAGDKWQIMSRSTDNLLIFKSNINGSEQAMAWIAPHATPASSTLYGTGRISCASGIFPFYESQSCPEFNTRLADDDVWYHPVSAIALGATSGAPTFTEQELVYPAFVAPYACELDVATIFSASVTAEDFIFALWKVTWTDGDTAPDSIAQIGVNFTPAGAGVNFDVTKAYKTTQTGLDTQLAEGDFIYLTMAMGNDPGTATVNYSYTFKFIAP